MKPEDYMDLLKDLEDYDKLLEVRHFEWILKLVVDEVTQGKGKERHGLESKFSEQPWKYITDGVGTGFTIGQAIKKLIEIKNFHEERINSSADPAHMLAYKREAMGAIVYIVMAIMWSENNWYLRNKPAAK